MSHDFKKLDVERAQIAVSLQNARDIVSQWISSDSENEEPPIKVLPSSTTGLGAKVEKAAPAQNTAMSRLTRTHLQKEKRPARPEAEEESDSDSDSAAESRTTISAKKRTVSALEAYKNSKKKKKR